jgi:hypothetical protein
VFSNPFPDGDHQLQAQCILVHLPLSPTLLLTWHCPTIVARLDHLLSTDGNEHAALRGYAQAWLPESLSLSAMKRLSATIRTGDAVAAILVLARGGL